MQPQTLLLGLGNILLGDEGIGIRALERLQVQYQLPETVQPLDGGVMGLELLTYVEDAKALLAIDAVQTGQPPGTLVRLEGEEIPTTLAMKLSMHQVNFQEVLAVSRLRGKTPPRLVVWGMEPAVLEPTVVLSEPIANQLDNLVQAVVAELSEWGVGLTAKVDQPVAER